MVEQHQLDSNTSLVYQCAHWYFLPALVCLIKIIKGFIRHCWSSMNGQLRLPLNNSNFQHPEDKFNCSIVADHSSTTNIRSEMISSDDSFRSSFDTQVDSNTSTTPHWRMLWRNISCLLAALFTVQQNNCVSQFLELSEFMRYIVRIKIFTMNFSLSDLKTENFTKQVSKLPCCLWNNVIRPKYDVICPDLNVTIDK